VVTDAARVLSGLVERCAYVSSASVHAWGEHRDETSPLVEADPGSGADDDYAAAERGAELGVLAAFTLISLRSGTSGPFDVISPSGTPPPPACSPPA
jgi:hypothetical protein